MLRTYEDFGELAKSALGRMVEASASGDTDEYVAASAVREHALREAALSMEQRKKLSDSDFVFPAKAPGSGSYPIHDKAHGANALARSSGKPEHGAVKRKVCSRYPDLPECKGD